MLNEIGAGVGGALTLGGVMAMFKFLNVKIGKKQDKSLCENIVENISKSLARGEAKFDKIMDALGEIKVDNANQFGRINQKLENLNGKT